MKKKYRSTCMTRINKERYTELGIMAKEYDIPRSQILNDLVQAEFQKFLEEHTSYDLTA